MLFENGLLTVIVDESDVLSGSLALRVSAPAGAPSASNSESIALTGTARNLFPEGTTFADSITVKLYYDAADLSAAGITNGTSDEYRLTAYWYDPVSASWKNYGGVVDPTDRNGALGSITFQTNHFSLYAVGVRTDLRAYAMMRSRMPRLAFAGETVL